MSGLFDAETISSDNTGRVGTLNVYEHDGAGPSVEELQISALVDAAEIAFLRAQAREVSRLLRLLHQPPPAANDVDDSLIRFLHSMTIEPMTRLVATVVSTVKWLVVEEPISAGLLEMARSAPTAGERVLAMLLCVAVFALKIYGILSPLIAQAENFKLGGLGAFRDYLSSRGQAVAPNAGFSEELLQNTSSYTPCPDGHEPHSDAYVTVSKLLAKRHWLRPVRTFANCVGCAGSSVAGCICVEDVVTCMVPSLQ